MSFRLAKRKAQESPFQKHKLGAVIVKGGRVLSTGYNEIRYTRELRKHSVHAEQAAILRLLKDRRVDALVGSEIYVSRTTPGGRVACAKPCVMCHDLIRSCGLRWVHYTDNEGTKSYKL